MYYIHKIIFMYKQVYVFEYRYQYHTGNFVIIDTFIVLGLGLCV